MMQTTTKVIGHLPNINQTNLLKGTSALDKSMDVELKKYVKKYGDMCKVYRQKIWDHISTQKKTKLEKIINNVHENFDIT